MSKGILGKFKLTVAEMNPLNYIDGVSNIEVVNIHPTEEEIKKQNKK